MARNTSTDYTRRRVDLSFFPALATPDVPVEMSIATPGGGTRAIAGASKVSQKFIKVFLTDKGSDRLRPTKGTAFPGMLRRGYFFMSQGEVFQIFNMQALAAVSYIQANTPPGTPLDEQIKSAALKNYTAVPGQISFRINLTTEAGEVSDFLLPVSW